MAATVELQVNVKGDATQKIEDLEGKIKSLTQKPIEIKIETGKMDAATKSVLRYVTAQTKLQTVQAKVLDDFIKATPKVVAAQAKMTDAQSKQAVAHEKTRQAAAKLNLEVEKQNTVQIKAASSVKKSSDSLNEGAKAHGEYAKKTKESVTQSNILIGVLRSLGHILVHEVRAAFNSALTEMKAVDTELITIQKVTNESAEGMKRYADDAYEVAARLGAGASEYLNAVAEFAKAGYADKSKELGELAITTAKVGDTTQSMANQFLLSVDAAYKYEGSIEKLTAVLDGANEIGNRFPTSVEKIAEGLGKVSPIAAQAHVGIDELTAAIGTITAVTQRSGAEASTALRALYLNIIGDTKTEIEDGAKWTAGEIEGLRDLLRKYAGDLVKAADETGKVINPMEAVRALYMAMREGVLTEQELMEQVSDIGGKLRSSQLLALIQNYDKYEKMLETYRDSAGSAAEEYAIYLDSWEAKTKQLSATWTDFVQRQLGTDKIKSLLDLLIDIVDNLDSIVPIVVSLGAAVVALNLPSLLTKIKTLLPLLFSAKGLLAAIAVGIGVVVSKNHEYVASLIDVADESKKRADKVKEEAREMLDLAAEYSAAKEGSEAYQRTSALMIQALGEEGKAVEDLTKKYREKTREKLQSQLVEASTAKVDAGMALEADYSKIRWGEGLYVSESSWSGESADSIYGKVGAMISSSPHAQRGFAGKKILYSAKGNTAEDVIAYYRVVSSAVKMMDEEVTRLIKDGDEAAAKAIKSSPLYKDLREVQQTIGGTADKYESAVSSVEQANRSLEGLDNYYDWLDFLSGENKLTESEFRWFIDSIRESNVLSEDQKDILTELGKSTYPEFAKAMGLVSDGFGDISGKADEAEDSVNSLTRALSKFQEATKKGAEKDDPFKDYKGAYDAVIKAGERGAYGSNAFQYGIQALLDPSIIKQFGNDWAGIYRYIKTTQADLYADSESMGTGLLQKIKETGTETSKGFYEVQAEIDGTMQTIASFDTKTGDFFLDDTKEGLAALAQEFGMSAESIVAFAGALGALDPSVNTEEMVKSLQELNAESDALSEKEPDITITTNADEAIGEINSVGNAVSGLPDSKTITVHIVTQGDIPDIPGKAKGDKGFEGGPVLVNDEPGGYNPELVVADGRAFIANGGNPAVVDLPRGAVIYSAKETRDIFTGSSGDLLNIPSYLSGTAKDYLGKTKAKKKPTSSESGSGPAPSASSNSASSEFTDDMMKKLEQYMSDILDMAEDALNDQLEAINAQIYALKYQTEAAEKATALEEARLQLLEAEKNLLDANTERTVRYYNAATGQWEWMADQREVMRAQEELYDAQKNLLEAEYDALATAWNELKDEIAKALENDEPIDINAILTALGKSAAKGSLPGLKALIGDIGTYTDDPRAWANFDGGGLAHGIGWMPKGSRGTEAVLDANLTKAILNPKQNAAFTKFTDSLSALFRMAGGSGALPSSRFSSSVSNLYGGNTYIEGVKIGSDMLNRPLSEVLSTLNLYKNN